MMMIMMMMMVMILTMLIMMMMIIVITRKHSESADLRHAARTCLASWPYLSLTPSARDEAKIRVCFKLASLKKGVLSLLV